MSYKKIKKDPFSDELEEGEELTEDKAGEILEDSLDGLFEDRIEELFENVPDIVKDMNKFVLKTVLFGLPIAFLYLFTLVFYATDKGDLIRVGYIMEFVCIQPVFSFELAQIHTQV